MKKLLLYFFLLSAFVCPALPEQTDVHNAEHLFDENGIAYLNIKGVGKTYNPSFVALYALNYAGTENYYKTKILPDDNKLKNSLEWLCSDLKRMPNGYYVFPYDFESTYNDITIKPPWYSAFGQAAGIEALLAGYRKFKDSRYLEAAEKAAEVLLAPLEKGGLLFQKGDAFIFEEIPVPAENPSHILNGNMRAMIAMHQLYATTGREKYGNAFRSAAESLKKLLPLYDTEYALRYDLNPKKEELLFRFNNPYNEKLPDIRIDSVRLRDPVSGKETILDFGESNDAAGFPRIAGNDWGQIERIDGKSVRGMRSIYPVNPLHDAKGGMDSPGTYFYFNLPSDWKDNLRTKWLELIIVYKDLEQGKLSVEMRSMAEGPAFRPLRDGALFLTGSGEWREWRVPVRPSDLGFWCGALYAEKHAEYLNALAKIDPDFTSWAVIATGYFHAVTRNDYKNVSLSRLQLPIQTPSQGYSFLPEENLIVQYHVINGKKVIQYNPFEIAVQANGIRGPYGDLSSVETSSLRPENAYRWLAKHAKKIDDASLIWHFEFDNAYNDVFTKAPWTSSFPQSYIVKALKKALDEKRTDPSLDYEKLYRSAINAYAVPLEKGGFTSFSRYGVFYEEVPNKTHVLNAHLSSMAELENHPPAKTFVDAGIQTLKNSLWLFDTGYWMRYDLNPKKEFLLQLDWLEGERSPVIASFSIRNPQTLHQTETTITRNAFKTWPGISGTEWSAAEIFDGRSAASFRNGYILREKPVPGGTLHNVYLKCSLPDRKVADWCDAPVYTLKLVYKDLATGKFQLKAQSICEGNVLRFVPLQNGVLNCVGDQQWKEAEFRIRPQDLGWFVGPDYQKFIVEQLERLGKNDWFFRQYALRQKHFLNFDPEKKPEIKEAVSLPFSLVSSGKTYPGHGVENSMDGNSINDYTAFYIESNPTFTLALKTPVRNLSGIIEFLDNRNYSSEWRVSARDQSGKEIAFFNQTGASAKDQKFSLYASAPIDSLKFQFLCFAGQKRLLMRQISLKSETALSEKTVIRKEINNNAEVKIEEIHFDFRNFPGIFKNIQAFSTDTEYKRRYEMLVDISDNTQEILKIPVNKRAAHITLVLSGFFKEKKSEGNDSSAPSISLQIDKEELARFERYRDLHKQIIFEGDDPKNPLSIIRRPFTQFYIVKAREILEEKNMINGTDFEKIMAFMEHITYMRVGFPKDSSPFGVLNERIGACGTSSHALNALASAVGIQCRVLSMANYPEKNGHSVTEVILNGKWRIFDPTYGLYFKDAKTGELMSFAELRDPANKAIPVYINKTRYDESGERTGWGTQRVYLYGNPAGPIGPDKPMIYPLTLAAGQRVSMPDLSFQGGGYLGAAMVNNSHSWSLTNLTPGADYVFLIHYNGVGGEMLDKPFCFECRNIKGASGIKKMFEISRKDRGKTIEITFKAEEKTVSFDLLHEYRGPKFHYLQINGYELKKVTEEK